MSWKVDMLCETHDSLLHFISKVLSYFLRTKLFFKIYCEEKNLEDTNLQISAQVRNKIAPLIFQGFYLNSSHTPVIWRFAIERQAGVLAFLLCVRI